MVAIKDMKMPSRCMNCEILGKEEMYCSKYPRKDLDVITVATSKPSWCPLVEIVTCKECSNHVKGALDEDICLRGHELIHDDFYCADAERSK